MTVLREGVAVFNSERTEEERGTRQQRRELHGLTDRVMDGLTDRPIDGWITLPP